MMDRKHPHRLRQTSPLLGLLLCALLPVTGAQAQTTSVLQRVTAEAVNNPRFQYYPFSYEVSGSSIWGPGVPGSQQVDFSLPLNSFPWTEHIGSFFDPCFGVLGGCEFGAGLSASLTASTSASFHARADLGSVDLHCPGGVGIIYPDAADIKPGQPFTIQTYCVVEPTAFMNINATNLSLSIGGRIEAKLDLSIIAEAAGHNLVDINLFSLLKLPTPNIAGEHELFNTGNLAQSIQDIPLPFPPNIATGFFHVPHLGARGTLRNDDKLKARAMDSFLTAHADLTNLLLQYAAFGIPIPLEGDYDFAGFNFSFHLLDLQLQAVAGIRQDFTFDPRPLIRFTTNAGLTRIIRAGESVSFIAPPAVGSLHITPTITYDQNAFSDKTAITVDPSLSFNLIKVKGGGHVAGQDLFSFNLNPFGTQMVEFPFDVPLFEQSFALPAPADFTCPAFIIGATAIKEVSDFTSITRSLTDDNGFASISGSVLDAAGSTLVLHVQGSTGSVDTSSDVGRDGYFGVTLRDVSQLGQYRPITVSGEYFDSDGRLIVVNPVTIYWPRPALDVSKFGVIAFDPNRVPDGRLVAFVGTGLFTLPLHSSNVEPDATLLYDDIPIPTSLARIVRGTLVTGEIPGFLMDRGGSHTLSFLNSGLNQEPVLLQTVLVNNAVPTVTDVLKRISEVDGSDVLMVRGSGFTLDTSVKIGGQPRSVTLVSPAEMSISLLPADSAPGIHPVLVCNPAPGGGNVSASYEVAPVIPDIPVLTAKHSLMRHEPSISNEPEGDTMADLITLTDAGKNVLRDVTITSVTLLVKGKTFTAAGAPQRLPVLQPGGYSSAQFILPAHSSVVGDVGVLTVRGTVHGKSFVLSSRLTMPAFIPLDHH